MKELLFNSGKVLARSRYPWIDYARAICIILVCYRHVFEGLAFVGEGSYSYPALKYSNIFFFSFRMPLFFIISGIFLGITLARTGLRDYLTKRFHTILYPLLIWGSIQVTLQLLFAGYVNAQRVPMDYVNLIIWPRRIEQFWYLNALFFVGALYAIIKVYGKVKLWQQLIIGVMFYGFAAYLQSNKVELGFLFDVFFFYLFFAIGDLMSDFFLNPGNYRLLSSPRTLLLILPFFLLIQHTFTILNLNAKDDYYVQYQMPAFFALAALVGGAFIINLSFLLEKYKVLPGLRVIGYHSLYIYVMHLMITSFTRIFFVRILGITSIPPIMITSLILGITLPIIFYNLANRMGGWWLFTSNRTGKYKQPEKTNWNKVSIPNPNNSYSTDKVKPL